MNSIFFFAIAFCLVFQTCSLHRLDSLETISRTQLEEDDLVEVVESATTKVQAQLNRDYYIIKVGRKNKKEAYFKIKKLFEKVVSILTKSKIIPREEALVKTRVKPQYQSKKRSWTFSTIFMIIGSEREL